MNGIKRTLAASAAAFVLIGGTTLVATTPAQAAQVNNNMLCEPDTGWCYQTNPPYNPAFPHACQWDYELHNLHSGMWYTGCTPGYWGSTIY